MASQKNFGIDVNVNEDIQQLTNSNDPLATKLEKLIDMVEEMHVVSRDSNAIFVDLLSSAEKKLNKRIDDLRDDLIKIITSDPSASAVVVAKLNHYKAEQSSTLDQVKADAASRNGSNGANGSASNSSTPPQKSKGPSPPALELTDPTVKVLKPDLISVTPMAGFVIKTKRMLGNKEKAFINVFHHPQVVLEPPHLPKDSPDNKPYLVIDEVAITKDKEGGDCLMFNVAVSSEYFRQPNHKNPKIADITITSPFCVQKIIHKINLKFSEYLDEGNYVLPRLTLGYKGDAIPNFLLPVEPKAVRTAVALTLPPLVHHAKPPLTPGSGAAGSGSSPPTFVEPGIATIPENPSTPAGATNGGAVSPARQSPGTVMFAEFPIVMETGSAQSSAAPSRNNSMYQPPSPPPHGNQERRVSDTDSIISDLTHDTAPVGKRLSSTGSVTGSVTGTHTHKRPSRKSLFNTSQMAFAGGDIQGRNMLHGDMLEYIREECVDGKTAASIKEECMKNPDVILGWQINIDPSEKHDEKASGIYVVTDMRKNLMSKTEFRISRYHQDDSWVKLKRGPGKSGYEFRPMRKVLYGLVDDEDNDPHPHPTLHA